MIKHVHNLQQIDPYASQLTSVQRRSLLFIYMLGKSNQPFVRVSPMSVYI